MRFTFLLMLASWVGFSSCQPAQPVTATPAQASETATTPAAGASTEAAARAAVARFVQQQPNAALYQLDSARALEVENHWQVLVPRTDWAGRMPNKAAFEVDKQTGVVTVLAVK
ncbi:hypothetical protein MUN84_09455 [Hymenobacter sp. 5516J-16]|uniref:hypothetical protein n=1 Tax=Hymenobacter sp. 5516J-16 TaxID=2932253 RepID=UPI001FD46826|nr:hypothetical protein [Hymenobacter sp. 5516J-16]UOQ78731.1 hypothetical protein MUN84_09455 [Hymenobacter sp. 5516J-16]